MAENLYMIALSPTMSEGTIARWRVAEGASFTAGAVLCEVETDKATMDYEAPKSGVLLRIVLAAGSSAEVGATIAVIGKEGEDPGSVKAAPQAKGAAVPSGSAPGPQPRSAPGPQSLDSAPGPGPAAQDPSLPPGKAPPSSPLARAIAAARGIDLARVRGSGPGGRVVRRDLEGLAAGPAQTAGGAQAQTGSAAAMAPGPATPQTPAAAYLGRAGQGEQRIPVSGKRAVIAKRLSASFFGAPHYYLKRRVEAERLLELRASINASREKPLSLNAFILKLCAEAILRHPYVNSTWAGEAIIQRSSVDLGLAVALPDGLITPVVRDCQTKGIAAIDEELSALIAKAKTKGLSPEEYEGAGFTVSNLGSYGVEEFTAIINPPGSAILAVGAVMREPVVLP
ncbi:MAG TPA: dihydrolipoamide acetyltransferase family protein, partial [Rectinemataceae bacterium]|nr:dihydrolipoamide acetyltransferase family protein [Rectinemataceae bacterium]